MEPVLFYLAYVKLTDLLFPPESLEIIATAATHSNSAIRKSVSTDVLNQDTISPTHQQPTNINVPSSFRRT